MDYNWEEIAMSQLRLVQRLTKDYDELKDKSTHELEIANNSIKTLLKEQEELHERIANLEHLISINNTSEPFKKESIIQEDLFKQVDKEPVSSYLGKPKKNYPNGKPNARTLTDDQARDIKILFAKGFSITAIALQFNVNRTVIVNIVNGITYKNVN